VALSSWFWAIPVFGLLIFIHELGHFAVAKYYDIRVHEFALGFGPVLFGFDQGETRYNLRAIPLGGFVRMGGMDDSEPDDPRAFNRRPLHARALVIVAGPVMNFVLASLLYSAFLVVVGVTNPAPILGELLTVCATPTGSIPCPAAAAGLQTGDRVISVAGTPVDSWGEIQSVVVASEGRPLLFRLDRGGKPVEATVQPVMVENRYLVGIQPSTKPESLGRALVQGPVMTVRISQIWIQGLYLMVVGDERPQLSGPIGITQEIARQASNGLDQLLLLTALLSINLGMFNLLPIPALDGSRLLFMGLELVRGRRLEIHRENMVHFVGFLILISLMLVVTYGEIFR